jgi:hypothetical protein
MRPAVRPQAVRDPLQHDGCFDGWYRRAAQPVQRALHRQGQPRGQPDPEEEPERGREGRGHPAGEASEGRQRNAAEPRRVAGLGREREQGDQDEPRAHGHGAGDAGGGRGLVDGRQVGRHGGEAEQAVARLWMRLEEAGDRQCEEHDAGADEQPAHDPAEAQAPDRVAEAGDPAARRPLVRPRPPVPDLHRELGDRLLRVTEEHHDQDRDDEGDQRPAPRRVGPAHIGRHGDGEAQPAEQQQPRGTVQRPEGGVVRISVEEPGAAQAGEPLGVGPEVARGEAVPRPPVGLSEDGQGEHHQRCDDQGADEQPGVGDRDVAAGQPLPGEQIHHHDGGGHREQAGEHQRQQPQHGAAGGMDEAGDAPARTGQHELGGVHDAERDEQEPERLGPRPRRPPAPVERLQQVSVLRPDLVQLGVGRPEDPAALVTGDLPDVRAAQHALRRRAAHPVHPELHPVGHAHLPVGWPSMFLRNDRVHHGAVPGVIPA